MAVTHADLEIQRKNRDLGSKLGTAVIVLCTLCGLMGFVFCIIAERTRSKATWIVVETEGGTERFKCVYTGDGKAPLLCGVGGFLTLAVGMIIQHAHLWMAVSRSFSPEGACQLMVWDSDSSAMKLLGKQAGFFFLTAWVCFAVAEVLLVIGIAVESTHIRSWGVARNKCLVIRHGSFIAAGVFDITTVFLATAFYMVILQMKREREHETTVRGEVVEAAFYSTSPQRSFSNSSPAMNSAANLEEREESGREEVNGVLVKASNSG